MLTSPARLCRPCRLAGPRAPRGNCRLFDTARRNPARDGLSAGGNRIRTIGPAPAKGTSGRRQSETTAEPLTGSGPRRQCLPGVAPHSLSLRGGTASSNPSSSAAVCLSGVPRTVSAKVAQWLAWPADRSRHQKTGTHDAGFGNAWVGDRSAAIGGLPGSARREAAAWQMAYPMITTSRADRPESNCHGKPCPRYSMPDT